MAKQRFSVDQWLADYLIPANEAATKSKMLHVPSPGPGKVLIVISDGEAYSHVEMTREAFADLDASVLDLLDDTIVRVREGDDRG